MLKFNTLYRKLMEDMGGADAAVPGTTGQALGPTQAQPAQIGKSGDFYAPGDARNIFGAPSKKKVKNKFKPPGFKKGKIIRRTLPTM
jgi:hypothetical protein